MELNKDRGYVLSACPIPSSTSQPTQPIPSPTPYIDKLVAHAVMPIHVMGNLKLKHR